MACFLSPGVVAVHCVADAAEDREQHRRSEAAVAYLEAATDAAGRPLRIVRILAPRNLVLTAAECLGLDDEGWRGGWGREGGEEEKTRRGMAATKPAATATAIITSSDGPATSFPAAT